MDPRLILPQEQRPFPPHTWEANVLSPPECDAVIKMGEALPLHFGTVGNGGNDTFEQRLDYRTVRQAFMVPTDENRWLFDRMREKVEFYNLHYYGFELHGLWENLVFLRYDVAEGEVPAGHYNWHQDFGGGRSSLRKLSFIVQLSDQADYEGCDLRIFTDREIATSANARGDINIFASWTPHMVRPITRGTRYALVGWVSGPRFR